jgi:hypothetical protein
MKSLYVFKSTPFNITNLPQWSLYLSRDDLYQPCKPILTNTQLDLEIGGFAQQFSPDPQALFRDIDWEEQLPKLDALINSIDQSVVFGVNSVEQLTVLKTHFKDQAITVSCSYNQDYYPKMLSWYVHRHIRLQNLGIIEITAHDRELRTNGTNLVDHYAQAFDKACLIPPTIDPVGDYDIPVGDFFNVSKFFNHMSCIGGAPTQQAIDFYNQWRGCQHL